jgi:hypothetical protein
VDPFSHLSVLISIILGLAITQLLQGFRGIVLGRARIRVYWVAVAWAVIVLVICVQSWWAMFGLRQIRDWTFLGFSVVLLQVLAIYMQAAFVLPDLSGDQFVDLHAHYFDHVGWIFGAFIVTLSASLLKDVVLGGRLPMTPNLVFHLWWLALSFMAAFIRREWFHRLNVLLAAVTLGVYVSFLFMRLQ